MKCKLDLFAGWDMVVEAEGAGCTTYIWSCECGQAVRKFSRKIIYIESKVIRWDTYKFKDEYLLWQMTR